MIADPTTVALAILGGLLVASFITLAIMQRVGRNDAVEERRSPVPWLADRVWRQLNPVRSFAARFGGTGRVVVNPAPTIVTDDDLERAGAMPVADETPLSPRGTPRDQMRRLLSTPGGGGINAAVWPVCCERLSTLISFQGGWKEIGAIEAQTGSLERAFLDKKLESWGGPGADIDGFKAKGWSEVLTQMRAGEHGGDGINVFQCRACDRVYVASCAP